MGQEIVDVKKMLAERAAKAAAAVPVTGGTFLSTRGGTLAFGDEAMPGNQAAVVILGAVMENTFYAEKFNPDETKAPICYAFGQGLDAVDMAPHESMQVDLNYFQPQAEECKVCPHSQWGSADTGRGKACQNRVRLALIPAGFYAAKRGSRDFDLELFDDPKHFQTAEIVHIKLPVMSVDNYYKFQSQVSAALRLPPEGVVARLFIEPDHKSQYKVHFEVIEQLPDELAAITMLRADEAMQAKIQGYRPPEEKPPGHTDNPRGSLRGIRTARPG